MYRQVKKNGRWGLRVEKKHKVKWIKLRENENVVAHGCFQVNQVARVHLVARYGVTLRPTLTTPNMRSTIVPPLCLMPQLPQPVHWGDRERPSAEQLSNRPDHDCSHDIVLAWWVLSN